MGNLFESLEDYFENTPKEILDNDWKEIEYLNEIGPDVNVILRNYYGVYEGASKELTHPHL